MKKLNVCLAALAIAMVLGAGIGSAWAYFTTYAEARGGNTIRLGSWTELHEEFSGWTKRVTVSSDAQSQPVYVRMRAYAGSEYELVYEDVSGKWTAGADGWYYYDDILVGGGATTELRVHIGNIPEDAEEGDDFNVVVVYESTEVCYDESGNPYADWNAKLDTGSTAEGGGES